MDVNEFEAPEVFEPMVAEPALDCSSQIGEAALCAACPLIKLWGACPKDIREAATEPNEIDSELEIPSFLDQYDFMEKINTDSFVETPKPPTKPETTNLNEAPESLSQVEPLNSPDKIIVPPEKFFVPVAKTVQAVKPPRPAEVKVVTSPKADNAKKAKPIIKASKSPNLMAIKTETQVASVEVPVLKEILPSTKADEPEFIEFTEYKEVDVAARNVNKGESIRDLLFDDNVVAVSTSRVFEVAADPPLGFDETPLGFDETPLGSDEPPLGFDEPNEEFTPLAEPLALEIQELTEAQEPHNIDENEAVDTYVDFGNNETNTYYVQDMYGKHMDYIANTYIECMDEKKAFSTYMPIAPPVINSENAPKDTLELIEPFELIGLEKITAPIAINNEPNNLVADVEVVAEPTEPPRIFQGLLSKCMYSLGFRAVFGWSLGSTAASLE